MFEFLLFPFAILYDFITRFRNYLYDTGRRGSVKFEANVISVGNLTVGGTGKTPHIEYLIRLLKGRYNVATLSRGYGRKTKGFILADAEASATSIGDEPFQYYNKYGTEITVAVGEDRAIAIPSILYERPDTKLILLDDAYQHRAVCPLLNILLSDYNRPFYKDYVLPYGRLRESRTGANRADVIIVSKCPPEIDRKEQELIENEIKKFVKVETPIYFSSIRYSAPKAVFSNETLIEKHKVLLFTGLANPLPFENHVKSKFEVSKHLVFKDHFMYKEADILGILEVFNQLNVKGDHFLMTTEKDMVKLLSKELKMLLMNVPIFYIPIEVFFINKGDEFDATIVKNGVVF